MGWTLSCTCMWRGGVFAITDCLVLTWVALIAESDNQIAPLGREKNFAYFGETCMTRMGISKVETLWLFLSRMLEKQLLNPSTIFYLSNIFALLIVTESEKDELSFVLPIADFKIDQHFHELVIFFSSIVLKYNVFILGGFLVPLFEEIGDKPSILFLCNNVMSFLDSRQHSQ